MESLRSGIPIVGLAAAQLKDDFLTLIDIGCSGGIDAPWREFGNRLRAFGFDPNLQDMHRLQAKETQPNVEYIAGFVGASKDSPDRAKYNSGSFLARNPWGRLAVSRTLQIRSRRPLSLEEKTKLNQWHTVPLADPEKRVVVSEFLRERKIVDVDFIKIDVDGADFTILQSLRSVLADTNVLGVGIEVNFFGSADPETNTLHNIDRFMKAEGFELFDLSKRHYAMAALPARYLYVVPAQSTSGRILQGDALYLRDLAAPYNASLAGTLKPAKIVKLAALFAMFGLPDCAADVLVSFRSAAAQIVDVERCLDALVTQAAARGQPKKYVDYIEAFERDDKSFYP